MATAQSTLTVDKLDKKTVALKEKEARKRERKQPASKHRFNTRMRYFRLLLPLPVHLFND